VQVRFDYPVIFTERLLDAGNGDLAWALLRNSSATIPLRVLVVADEGFARAWPALEQDLARYARPYRDRFTLHPEVYRVPGGEAAKNDPGIVAELRDAFGAANLDRHSIVLGFGGGAALDAIGYAAATTHRGVRLIRVPTTVLAQNDAGVGVKNGINGRGAKNFEGTFAPPFAVLCDSHWLSTLSPRHRRAGLAEAVKVALIRDGEFFDWIERHVSALATAEREAERHMIRRCAELHLQHIRDGGDPFEMGNARPLDFGHWSAHKLETLTAHALLHGEAVSIGIALDTCYSRRSGALQETAAARILAVLEGLGLPLWDDALLAMDGSGRPAVLAGLEEFREHLGGELNVTLLGGVGSSHAVHHLDPSTIMRCVEDLRRRQHHASIAQFA